MKKIRVNIDALKQIILKNKLYEIRLKKGIFNNIKKGDTLSLFNGNLLSTNTIIDIQEFKNLDELFKNIDFRLCTPLIDNKLDAIKHISKFYKDELMEKYEVIAIKLS